METDSFSLFFPEGLLEHFIITKVEELGDVSTKKMCYFIDLEERNVLPPGYDPNLYESKGFTDVQLQDFPIRGKAVYLNIKRRRWRNKTNPKEIIRNDYSYVAEGSKLTKELLDFLKATGRYTGRYDK